MSVAGIASLVLGADAGPLANATAAQSASAPVDNSDTVQLTEAEQVYELYNQGQRVSQIAAALDLPLTVVDSYLNLSGSAG